jgi:CRP-like cAMP-binding protein
VHPDPDDLRKVALFAGVTDAELAQLADWFDIEEFSAGRSIAHEGRSDYAFFVLDQGTVEVSHDGKPVGTLAPGDVFGELALLGDGHRQADAVAATDTVVLSMFGTHFREMQASMPVVAQRVSEIAEQRKAQLES